MWRTPDSEAAEAVEKAGRDLNREIVHELNEAGVASVRVIGADRGLLRFDENRLGVGRTGWVARLVEQGVVVVVAAFADRGEASLQEVDAAAASAALAQDLGTAVAMIPSGGVDPQAPASVDDVSSLLPDAAPARRVIEAGASVVVLDRGALRRGEDGIQVL